jgi:hypothetical protein
MARRKAVPPPRPAKQQGRKPHQPDETPPLEATKRRFLNRGVQVEVSEAPNKVALTLDGVPIDVSVDRGEYFAHVAHMFTAFGSIDALVDHLLENEGRTWTLHGHVCDENCRGGHHHDHGAGQGNDHSHHDHDHAPVTPVPPHEHGDADHQHGDNRGRQPARRAARKPRRRGGAR